MKYLNLTQIANNNGMKYNELRNKLIDLNIIHRESKRYIPTSEALKAGIAIESGRFANEQVLSISYKYDEVKLMYHFNNHIKLKSIYYLNIEDVC